MERDEQDSPYLPATVSALLSPRQMRWQEVTAVKEEKGKQAGVRTGSSVRILADLTRDTFKFVFSINPHFHSLAPHDSALVHIVQQDDKMPHPAQECSGQHHLTSDAHAGTGTPEGVLLSCTPEAADCVA